MTGQLTYPDYGVYPSQIISPEGDLGEIAAKLAHPRYRREGRILSFADCSPNLDGWRLDHDAIIEYMANATTGPGAVSGTSCITCSNTGPATTAILKFLPVSLNRRMGLEFMFSFVDNNTRILAELCYWTGIIATIGRIRFNSMLGQVEVQDDNGYHEIMQLTDLTIQRNWLNFKMVTDFDQSSYIRMYINNQEFPVNYNLRVENTTPEAGTFFAIYGYAHTGTGPFEFQLDNMLITTNER